MRVSRERWVFDSDGISFADYPFFPASVFPAGRVAATDIDDIDLLAPPPTVRVGAELLYVSAVHRDELKEFAETHRIPVASRHDRVWSDILEPFLDTEFDEAFQRRTMRRLHAAGLDASQVEELRVRFAPAMWLYNFAIPRWEWVHLGLFDLLEATHPESAYPDDDVSRRLREGFRIPPGPFCTAEEYPGIYWEAMRIALLPSP